METDTAADSVAWSLVNLPPSVVSDEETREVLEAYFTTVVQARAEGLDPAFAGLPGLLDPWACPDQCFDALLSMQGFSAGLPWVSGLPEHLRRRLGEFGVELWRRKGQPDAIRAICRLLGLKEMVIWDSTLDRFAPVFSPVGETDPSDQAALPVLVWEDLGDAPSGPHVFDLHMSDPLGTASRARVAAALRTIGHGCDTLRLVWCLLADAFVDGLDQWTPLGGATADSGTLQLPSGSAVLSNTEGEKDWKVGRVLASVKRDDSAGFLELRLGLSPEDQDPDPEYGETEDYLQVQFDVNEVSVTCVVDDQPVPVCTGSPGLPDDGRWHWVDVRRWRAEEPSTGSIVQVWIDGELVAQGPAS